MYKLNDKIKKEDIGEVSRGITLKALKVIEAHGEKLASEIIEGKRKDIFQDLIQEVSLQIILNDYIITKECFKCVRKFLYNENKNKIELIIEENNSVDELDKTAYIKYINSYQEEEKSNDFNIGIILEGLTERQKEIILMYSKLNSMQQVANILNISKGTVNNTIRRLRDKIQEKQYIIA